MSQIKHHQEQNDFFESLKLTHQKAKTGIFVLEINDVSEEVAECMDMYRNEFYEINLIKDQFDFKFTIDEKTYQPNGEPYLTFVAPYQLQTYEVIGDKLGSNGYLVYLNKDTFRHLNLGDDYPFFKRDQENLFILSSDQYDELFQLARNMEDAFQKKERYSESILQSYTRIFLLKKYYQA